MRIFKRDNPIKYNGIKDLLSLLSTDKRTLILKIRDWQGERQLHNDLQHYFNEYGEELGYTCFQHSHHASIQIFDTPRLWSRDIMKNYLIQILR